MKGITVDAHAIALGLYHDILTTEDKTLLAFGMINLPIQKMITRQLTQKFDDIILAQEDLTPEQLDDYLSEHDIVSEKSLTEVRRDWVTETSRLILIALYRVANDAGGMVV